MGAEIAALMGFFGITGAFALIGTVLAGWMAWRIVEKAGLPGWAGLGSILLSLTAVGAVVPLILLWVFAYMRWPRDEPAPASPGYAPPPPRGPPPPTGPAILPPPPAALADGRGWKLTGVLGNGGTVALTVYGGPATYALTGALATAPTDLSVPDPSVGQPHARLMTAGQRLGLEDLGSPGGTFIDGARLLPEHGPRDISAARIIRLGSVELSLTRA
ncbi:FHA domain-containing protein [Reyranella sp.]|uniref:FHA domain-containing protein n=1 Tax=Reyranella sp. TaxID=1929291 RepID=UPI0012283212|nr:FHA domain-containing protein [Reyranella sp.]TAJ81868.1 MAG: FHA domain-containing protein [Reyranella sp.]